MYVVNEEADDNLFIVLRVGVEHSYTLNSGHFPIFVYFLLKIFYQ